MSKHPTFIVTMGAIIMIVASVLPIEFFVDLLTSFGYDVGVAGFDMTRYAIQGMLVIFAGIGSNLIMNEFFGKRRKDR